MNKKSYLSRVRLPRTPAEWLEAVMNFIFFLCGMLAVGCVVPVSYTHLDVYKRQAQYGIWNKENASSVTLKDAAFKDNENDVYLEAGQYNTIEDTFTDTATVKVADSPIATPRQITTRCV